MNAQTVVLLTRDLNFEKELKQALPDSANVLVHRNMGDALQAVCDNRHRLGLVIVDFDDGCHGMTLLSAMKMLDDHLPIIGVTSSDTYHAAAVASANGATACVAKPIVAAELKLVIGELGHAKTQLMVA